MEERLGEGGGGVEWGGGGGGLGGYRVEVIPGGKLPMVIVTDWRLLSIEALDEVKKKRGKKT